MERLKEEKYRLFNKNTWKVEFYTLFKLINTVFEVENFEFRGRCAEVKDKNWVELYWWDILKKWDSLALIVNIMEHSYSWFKIIWEKNIDRKWENWEKIGDWYENKKLLKWKPLILD